jgi:arylsulfatase A-like enzyme
LSARAPALMARTERWHYIWNTETGEDALYDMQQDPHEERNIAAQHPDVVRQLRERIEAWHATVQQPIDIADD